MDSFLPVSCSSNELAITPMDENPMSPPATLGVSARPVKGRRTPAAIGMPTALYAKAHPRFCLILANVALLSSMESTTCEGESPRSTMDATSDAAPTPPAIATPTSACARAAASLMPSPTMATDAPCDWSFSTS